MYEIEKKKSKEFIDHWYYKTKNEFGQILMFEIFNYDWSELSMVRKFTVKFYISTKRKQGYKYLEQTGKDGLKSLSWAKRCLIDFMKSEVKEGDKIEIYADNTRRLRAYEYGLRDLGFKRGQRRGIQSLCR